MAPRIQNLNLKNSPAGKVYPAIQQMNPQKTVSSNNTTPNKFSNYDARVSSSSMPVIQNIAVSKVSSLQTSSQQYISSNGQNVAIGVTVQSNFNAKRSSSMQFRPIQNIESTPSSSEKNSQQQNFINNKNVMPRVNVKNIESFKGPSVQLIQLRPIQNIVTGNLSVQSSSHQNANISSIGGSLKNEQNIDTNKPTNPMQLMQSHSISNVLLLPPSSMETKKTFHASDFDIQSEIEIASTDLNDNKPDIPMDLAAPITAKRDSKTNSIEDIKLCSTPIECENDVNETDCIEVKSVEITENLSSNFLQKMDGDVLSVLSFNNQFLVIQEKLLSLWTLPSELFSIFGVAQQYVCIGKVERYNCDIEIDTPYQHRLLVVGSKTFYVELRAKKLTGTYTRESLMSIYLTFYSMNDDQELTLRHIELDRVHGSIQSIRYTILPKSRSFVICWYEGVTNVRKYNLNANLLNLESVLLFPGCREHLKKLQALDSDTVIGFGFSTITLWDSRSGDITCKIDTNTPIGDNLHFFTLNENSERALLLIQSYSDPIGNGQLIKLMAINMNKNYSWKVICTHKMPSNGAKTTSLATITNHFIVTYENGQSFLLNLYNPRQFVVHSTEAKASKCFVTNDKIVAIDYNQLIAKTFVDHFFG